MDAQQPETDMNAIALFARIEIAGRAYTVLDVQPSMLLLSRAGKGSVYSATFVNGVVGQPRFMY